MSKTTKGTHGTVHSHKAEETSKAKAKEPAVQAGLETGKDSAKGLKQDKPEDFIRRVTAEGLIHSNLNSVISKLETEGTLEKLYGLFKEIFENEVRYTLDVLKVIKTKSKNQVQDFDLKEQLYNNIYIFKENFKTTLKILVDDLWNNHVSNTHFLTAMIGGHVPGAKSKEDPKAKTKTKPVSGSKSTNCFEIKEAPDEDELETPLARQKAQTAKSTSNLLSKVDEALAASLTDRPPEFDSRLSQHEEEEPDTDFCRRESKSVEGARSSPLRRSEGGPKKARPDINTLFHKKINVDIFSAAMGGQHKIGSANSKKKKDDLGNRSNPRPKGAGFG